MGIAHTAPMNLNFVSLISFEQQILMLVMANIKFCMLTAVSVVSAVSPLGTVAI